MESGKDKGRGIMMLAVLLIVAIALVKIPNEIEEHKKH